MTTGRDRTARWIAVPTPEWGPWRVSVMLGAATDGSPVVIGLHIDPDPDAPMSEQRIGQERLRRFPIGAVKAAALVQQRGPLDPDALAARAAALTARADDLIAQMEHDRPLHEAALASIVGKKKARLIQAAGHYEAAVSMGWPPRQYVAERLGVHTQTVDRLLREARKVGLLAPYEGGQGKHGKATS